MILGVGVDLCRIERIRRSVEHFGKSWLNEVFTDDEQQRLGHDEHLAHQAAIGFALKEACSKTIGSGFAGGVRRQDFVVHLTGVECSVDLTGTARDHAALMSRSSTEPRLHTQFGAAAGWVTALAVLECGTSRRFFADHSVCMSGLGLIDVIRELQARARRQN